MKNLKHIEWLIPIPDCTLKIARNSNLASVRIRAALCAEKASENGVFASFSDGFDKDCPDVLLIGKIDNITDPTRAERWLSRIASCKAQGSHIVVDYTDHHLGAQGPSARFYQLVLPLANTIVCSSRMLAHHLHNCGIKHAHIIPDPIEVDIQAPKSWYHSAPCALWFGHATNLPYFMDFLATLRNFPHPFGIVAITNAYPLADEKVAQIGAMLPDYIDVAFLPWSINTLTEVAKICDFAIIPAGVNDPRKNGASANRLLTAMALGLPALADPLDSYMDFQEYFQSLNIDNLTEFIWGPSADFSGKVLAAQSIISRLYTRDAIGNNWVHLLSSI